jgi:RNA polymerase sigma-70 factor (ECF subfamily)
MRFRAVRGVVRRRARDVRADEFRATLRSARDGDEGAVTTLYRLLHPRLIRYLRVVAPVHAERVAAETWIEVVGGLGAFDGDERALYAFGFSAARRRASGAPAGDERSASPDELAEDVAPDQVDDDGMAGFGLRSALVTISRLPRDEAEVVLLRLLGEMSVDEVAGLLDRPAESIALLQRQALRTLNWLTSTASRAS